MDGDGDILGMRRRPEPAQAGTAAAGASSQGSSGTADAAAVAATGAAALRHATGASPLKRQRSLGGGGMSARVESEDVEGVAGEVPVDQLNPEQLRRYQAWKRSRFERGPVRELILNRAAPTLLRSLESGQGRGVLQETSTIAVASMAKQFVGDLVEEAKRAQLERGDTGPLRPSDLLGARETLARDGRGPPLRPAIPPRQYGMVGGGGGGGGVNGRSLLGGTGVLTKGNPI
ncbi:unnamed protein product [Scytosiphon promiscuus]